MYKMLLGGALVVIAIIAGVYWYQGNKPAEEVSDTNTEESAETSEPTSNQEISWSFREDGTIDNATGESMTTVVLLADGKEYEIGSYGGSCSEIKGSAWTLQTNEVSGVICWFAGGGQEIGVFKENGKFNVKVGDLDEGTAEEAGFRENFKTILTLP